MPRSPAFADERASGEPPAGGFGASAVPEWILASIP